MLDQPLTPDTEAGVVVVEMIANGPASKSDLRTGDVIVAVDSQSVKTARELQEAIALQTPGRVIKFRRRPSQGTSGRQRAHRSVAVGSSAPLTTIQHNRENRTVHPPWA